MKNFFDVQVTTKLSDYVVAADGKTDIDSILRTIKNNSASGSMDEVIVQGGQVKVVPKDGSNEETTTKLSDHVVATDGKTDIDSILRTIKNNSASGSMDEVIVQGGQVKVVPKDGSNEETTTKLSDHVVAGYWYKDYPQIYQFERNSLIEQRNKMGAENFAFQEGYTSDGKLYFILSIRLKIDKILPNYKVHKFLMVYGHNFNNETSGSFGGQSLKVYPADPDESYYYRNGEIFHHLLPRDENNRHYMCRAQSKANARDINAYNSVEEILRWLFVFYIWKATGTDIDK